MILRKKAVATIAALFLLGVSASSQAAITNSPFNIIVNFTGGLTTSQQSVFTQAELFWESKILSYNSTISFTPGLSIDASGAAIDGVNGILGQASPLTGVYDDSNTYMYVSTGKMNFDTADLSAMELNGSLYSVIMHEMGHVLGFGTMWELNNLYNKLGNPGKYTGANALARYQSEFDPAATYVPVELTGGAGTAHSHWAETWAGGPNEVMTGWLNSPTTFSDTTLASFMDLGYNVNLSAIVAASAPVPIGFAISGLFLFGAFCRKTKKV